MTWKSGCALAFALLLGWGAVGCSGKREVSGQVFVVTKGGENVKLGLVGIRVIEERRLAEIAARLLGEAQKSKAGEALLLQLESEVKAMVSTVPEAYAAPVRRFGEQAAQRRKGIAGFSGDTLSRRFMGELPAAMAQTDADGLFTVEASSSAWMAARGERRAGSNTETYLWLIPMKTDAKKLLVSNDRLLEDDDDLARVLAGVGGGSLAGGADPELVSWVDVQRKGAKQALLEAKAAEERALAEAKAKAEASKARLVRGGPFEPGESLLLGVAVHWIPAGRFAMGSPSSEKGRFSDESQHEVVLSRGFFMAETECTQGQWEAVVGSNPSYFKGKDRPVEQVSWEEAVEFCRKLTAKQRQEGVLPEGWEWRLPTEAEWEYAARAGTTGARHGELDAIAWHEGNSGSETHGVKGKEANAWGLHDMIGNVWEWCGDWHGDYPTGSVTDPTGPGSGSGRVYRGGSWLNDARLRALGQAEQERPGLPARLPGLPPRPQFSSVSSKQGKRSGGGAGVGSERSERKTEAEWPRSGKHANPGIQGRGK